MNLNIPQVDYFSKMFAMEESEAVLVLFDFKAAFPSIEHTFMWEALAAAGLSPAWIRAIKQFYLQNRQSVVVGGIASWQR